MKLLVVDDEKTMANAIRDNLEYEGFSADCAYGGQQAIDALQADNYSLVILDVMMPDINGFQVLEKLRSEKNETPVIFLTARSSEADKLRGLGLGADDYVVKPFSVLELMARVKSVLHRTRPGFDLHVLELGLRTVDFKKLSVTSDQKEEGLGRYEADILQLLASKPGHVFSRADLLEKIWGMEAFPSNRTIDNYIVKLRQKIESDPKNPTHLLSIYGKGYKLTSS